MGSLRPETLDTISYIRDIGTVSASQEKKVTADFENTDPSKDDLYQSTAYLSVLRALVTATAMVGYPFFSFPIHNRTDAILRGKWEREQGVYWSSVMLVNYLLFVASIYDKVHLVRKESLRYGEGVSQPDISILEHCEIMFLLVLDPSYQPAFFFEMQQLLRLPDYQRYAGYTELLAKVRIRKKDSVFQEQQDAIEDGKYQIRRIPGKLIETEETSYYSPAVWEDHIDSLLIQLTEAQKQYQQLEQINQPIFTLQTDRQADIMSTYFDPVLLNHFPNVLDSHSLKDLHTATAKDHD